MNGCAHAQEGERLQFACVSKAWEEEREGRILCAIQT